MKVPNAQSFFSQRKIQLLLALSFVFNILLWFLAYMPSQTPLVLRYNVLSGIEKVGDTTSFFVFPAIALFILVVNLLLAFFYFDRERMLSYLFLAGGMFVQTIFLLTILAIRFINGY